MTMFGKVLIANRGAISVRIQRTLGKMGVSSIAVYSQADAGSLHVQHADQAVCLGEALATDTYLSFDKVIAAARETGAEAIHPGYGVLSENLDFAAACEQAGIVFIGPRAEQISAFGLKHTARALAQQSGVPLLPGSGLLTDVEDAVARAAAALAEVGVQSIAIVFLHAYANPAHEHRAADIVRRTVPDMHVTTSHEIAPEIREYERTSTTVINAYIKPLAARYLDDILARFDELGIGGPFHLMLSNGGLGTVDEAKRAPVRLLESGPAAGALLRRQYLAPARPAAGTVGQRFPHGADHRPSGRGG